MIWDYDFTEELVERWRQNQFSVFKIVNNVSCTRMFKMRVEMIFQSMLEGNIAKMHVSSTLETHIDIPPLIRMRSLPRLVVLARGTSRTLT